MAVNSGKGFPGSWCTLEDASNWVIQLLSDKKQELFLRLSLCSHSFQSQLTGRKQHSVPSHYFTLQSIQATPRDHLPCWAIYVLAPEQLAQSSTSSPTLWQDNTTCLGCNTQGCCVLIKMERPHPALGYTQILQSTIRHKARSFLHCPGEWIWRFWQDYQPSASWQMPVWLQIP